MENAYLALLQEIRDTGLLRSDRTNTGTYGVFGRELRYDLSKGLPVITTKRVHVKSVIVELLWFIRGESNIQYLKENKVRIWDEWASDSGELGPVYGCQWRRWKTADGEHIDQLASLVTRTGTDSDDLAFLRLFLGGVRNDNAAGGLFLGFDATDQNTVVQRTKCHA